MNNIITIRPYKFGTAWVFDDTGIGPDGQSFNLNKEALVCGTDKVLDVMCMMAGIPMEKAHAGFTLMFSSNPIPGYQLKARRFLGEKKNSETFHEGNWYEVDEPSVAAGMQGWLCPALFKYFDEAPETIYAIAQD